MAGRIPRDFIDDLLARADIVDLIDSRVKLKKAGKNYQACCPFHSEKTPSFTVSQEKQFYHCFGCGAHGNAISFLMEYERLEFPEAIDELASFYNLDVPREASNETREQRQQRQQQAQTDYALMEQAARFYMQQLKTHDDRALAVDYLKGRGLSGEIVKRYGIGYAPEGWDNLMKSLSADGQHHQQMTDLKLLSQNDSGRTFDFFRDRIMFPIRDKRGRTIAFGGRVLDSDQSGPKYLNSPETRIFHKGSELYGFHEARTAHKKLARVVIVEGYMDVVALAQYGIDYGVATLGTATSEEHIRTLFRATASIICCFDGDRAGRDAAWRALENALPNIKDGKEIRFLFLPDGEDPDTLVRKIGKDAFEQQLDQAQSLSNFLLDSLRQRHNITSDEGKMALKAEAMGLITPMEEGFQKQKLLQRLSELVGEAAQFHAEQQRKAAQTQLKAKKQDFSTPDKTQISPVKSMLWLLLHYPELARRHQQVQPAAVIDPAIKGLDMLTSIHTYCAQNPGKQMMQILEDYRQHPIAPALGKVVAWEPQIQEEQIDTLYQDAFSKILDWHLGNRMDELLAKSRVSRLSDVEKQELNLLMKEQAKH